MMGFYVNWDESSYESLAANIDKLTAIMPEWYHVGGDGRIRQAYGGGQAEAMRLIRRERPDMKVMPIVNNFAPGQDPKAVARVLRDPAASRRMAAEIVRTISAEGYDGVNIDFEGLPSSSREDLVRFMRALYPLAKRARLEVSLDVLADAPLYDYERLADSADYLVPMMYDEHWRGSASGPVASHGWYERSLVKLFDRVPPRKVVIALGSWAYEWREGERRAKAHTYEGALYQARRSGVPVRLDGASLNPTFTQWRGGARRRLWMLDAVTMFNQMKTATSSKPRGYAIWRLGAEDPDVWRVVPKRDRLDKGAALSLRTQRRAVTYDESRGLIVGQYLRP